MCSIFNNQNHNQLIANIYFQNDAGDADVVAYSASGVAATAADQMPIINELRKTVSDFVYGVGRVCILVYIQKK